MSKASNKFSESVLSIEEPPEPAEGQPQPELIRPNDDDDTEGGHHGVNNWVQAVSNAETEVSAILCGFLFKEFGEELIKFHAGQGANHDEHSTKAVGAMLGFVFFACMVYAVVLGARESLEEKLGEEGYESLQDHSSMTISWAVSTAGKWVTYWATATTKTESILHSITIRKLLAASWLTPAMVMLLIGMDFLADNNMFDDYKAEGIIACTGLITGLTWEQSFGSSVWTISRSTDIHPAVVQTVLGLGLVMVLVPGWMRFIVPVARQTTPKRDHVEAGAVADATADAAPDSTAKRPSG